MQSPLHVGSVSGNEFSLVPYGLAYLVIHITTSFIIVAKAHKNVNKKSQNNYIGA
jgi:hypothetical protein